MVTLLLAQTESGIDDIISEVENMCHSVGISVIVHHDNEPLDEIFDLLEGKVIVFSPGGESTLDEIRDDFDSDVVLVVGGFTEEKDLDSEILARADVTVTLGEDFLEIPEVVKKIIGEYGSKRK